MAYLPPHERRRGSTASDSCRSRSLSEVSFNLPKIPDFVFHLQDVNEGKRTNTLNNDIYDLDRPIFRRFLELNVHDTNDRFRLTSIVNGELDDCYTYVRDLRSLTSLFKKERKVLGLHRIRSSYAFHVLHPFIFQFLQATATSSDNADPDHFYLGIFLHSVYFDFVKEKLEDVFFFLARVLLLSLSQFTKANETDHSTLPQYIDNILSKIYQSRIFCTNYFSTETDADFSAMLLVGLAFVIHSFPSSLSKLDVFSVILQWMMDNGHVDDCSAVLQTSRGWFQDRSDTFNKGTQVSIFNELERLKT
ncbi:hypothetical protein GEMRC1_008766 [Eukaryota sp. GEM-RC1]